MAKTPHIHANEVLFNIFSLVYQGHSAPQLLGLVKVALHSTDFSMKVKICARLNLVHLLHYKDGLSALFSEQRGSWDYTRQHQYYVGVNSPVYCSIPTHVGKLLVELAKHITLML